MTQPSKRKNFLFAICLSTLATVYSVAEMIVFALSHNIVALEIMIAVFCIVLFVLLVCISFRHRWHVWYDFVLVCLLLLCWIAEAHFAFLANFHFNPQDFYSTYYMRFPCVIEIVDRMVGSDIVTRRSRWAYINFLFSIAALSSFATAKITRLCAAEGASERRSKFSSGAEYSFFNCSAHLCQTNVHFFDEVPIALPLR